MLALEASLLEVYTPVYMYTRYAQVSASHKIGLIMFDGPGLSPGEDHYDNLPSFDQYADSHDMGPFEGTEMVLWSRDMTVLTKSLVRPFYVSSVRHPYRACSESRETLDPWQICVPGICLAHSRAI